MKWTRVGTRLPNEVYKRLLEALNGKPIAEFIRECIDRFLENGGWIEE